VDCYTDGPEFLVTIEWICHLFLLLFVEIFRENVIMVRIMFCRFTAVWPPPASSFVFVAKLLVPLYRGHLQESYRNLWEWMGNIGIHRIL